MGRGFIPREALSSPVRDLVSGPRRVAGLLLAVGFGLAGFGFSLTGSVAYAANRPPTVAPSSVSAIWGNFHYLNAIAYAPSNNSLYVTSDWGPVFVINGSTDTVAGTFGSFPSPFSAVYDPEANELFVGDQGRYTTGANASMYVVDLGTGRAVQTIPGANPYGTVYDPVTHAVYLEANGSVLVLDAKTNAVERAIAGLSGFRPQAYDPARDLLFGVNDTDILAVNVSRDAVVWTTPNPLFGVYPIGYDPLNGDVYLFRVRRQSFDVDAVDGATGATVATITNVANPGGFLFDPANGDMYLSSNGAYWELVVVNATLNIEVARFELSAPPGALAYDSANRDVYVACTYPTSNFTGVVLVFPSAAYPLPNPWPGFLLTLGELGLVGGVIAAVAVVAARRRYPGGSRGRP